MWIQLPDGTYGNVVEVVDLDKTQTKIDALKAKKILKQADHQAFVDKLLAVEDLQLRQAMEKGLDDSVAPIVLIDRDISELELKVSEILA